MQKNLIVLLVGGETAEMPGMYKVGEFDLAGFAVGVVERKNLLIKDKVNSECVIIGLESSGFHSNGYSLIRKILKKFKKLILNPLLPTKVNLNILQMTYFSQQKYMLTKFYH